MTKNDPRKALGKGLHSLLPARNSHAAGAPATIPTPASSVPATAPAEGEIHHLPVDQITPNPDQPRREFDETALMELTQSIEREGVIQPIIVRRTGPAEYQIIAGERRWRASRAAGLKEVPVILRTADDQRVLELAIVENIQREDLNPIDLAIAFQRMAVELGLSHDQIGHKTGKERTTITNSVRLLQLPADIQQLIGSRQLSAGHARALLKFEDQQIQRDIAQRCIAEGWSVRQIEQFTKPRSAPPRTKEKPPQAALDPNVKFAISQLEGHLGTKVRIINIGKGKGHIEIEFYNADDLSRIYEIITNSAG